MSNLLDKTISDFANREEFEENINSIQNDQATKGDKADEDGTN